ncbi:MAG: hypothetical protein QM617_14655 [Comamonas sp.]
MGTILLAQILICIKKPSIRGGLPQAAAPHCPAFEGACGGLMQVKAGQAPAAHSAAWTAGRGAVARRRARHNNSHDDPRHLY